MQTVQLPGIGTAEAWREAARACLTQGLAPQDVVWAQDDSMPDLFGPELLDEPVRKPSGRTTFTVPRSFVALADTVVWHSDPERFARLYALLWRLKGDPGLMGDRGDPALSQLRFMGKSVRRCQHKMKAFVRFREVETVNPARRRFAAWFEPTHHTIEPTAPFFARRFADMDWCIATPGRTVIFADGRLSFTAGQQRSPRLEDATEALWSTYFAHIFNPARLKVKAMQAEMPKKYWRNMPEAQLIPEMIMQAGARAEAMRAATPTSPPRHAEKARTRAVSFDRAAPLPGSLAALSQAAEACTRCPLFRNATQVVMGEGPADAELMFVGEQPGDREDLVGRPFVGPAGQLFDDICRDAGIDRGAAFVTNAVKHFKFTPRGKRRLHQRPSSGEISSCNGWLEAEMRLVEPRLAVALGATAAEALTGSGKGILARRGGFEQAADGTPVLITIHPSYLLRLPDAETRTIETEKFRRDLEVAGAHLKELRSS